MAEPIERSIAEWYGAQLPATPSPDVESVSDFILAELNRRKLRYFDGWVARFEGDARSRGVPLVRAVRIEPLVT
jgi:hypothetical protein